MAGASPASSKTVMITGVSRGLGKVLALELARRGHTIVGCARSLEKVQALQAEIAAVTPAGVAAQKHFFTDLDVSSDARVRELARILVDAKQVPDVLVNNAGTINKNKKLWEISPEEFDSVIDINIKGTANVLRHFLPLMIEKKQGIIVNMSSGWGRSTAAEVSPYCASKWAIEGLTRSVAKELPTGMAAVALNPGVVNTDMLASCFGNSASLYQSPESWAPKAATMILSLTADDNGASLTV
ncbi:NAD(P)-binding Rossmann-fold superfamily protein [Wolffia australiana]